MPHLDLSCYMSKCARAKSAVLGEPYKTSICLQATRRDPEGGASQLPRVGSFQGGTYTGISFYIVPVYGNILTRAVSLPLCIGVYATYACSSTNS